MATPDFNFYRDWIMHVLGEVSAFVTDLELSATMAEINRDIMNDLGLRSNVKTGTVTYSLANQYATLPSDALIIERLSVVENDEESFIDTIDYRDVGLRASYIERGQHYSYVVGRQLKFSWEVTEDVSVMLYYIPFLTDGTLDVTLNSEKLGTDETIIPVSLGRAFRYGVMADLMNVHGKTELHEVKARRWDGIYRNLVARAQKNIREIAPQYRVHKRRNY